MTVFIDTNVLVYSRDNKNPDKRERSQRWLRHLWDHGSGRLSTQVLNEFYYTATRKLNPGLTPSEARTDVRNLMSMNPVAIDSNLVQSAFAAEDRYGINYWDALIVAAAQAAGCSHLLTEDLQHNQHFGSVQVINPFLVDPESI